MARNRLRPARFDDLGLRRALGDRMLPLLVAAMAFLAALALGGLVAAKTLARNWQAGAGSALTVQVPRPGVATGARSGETRLDAVLSLLRATPGIAAARPLSDGELADLLRPWLGAGAERLALPLPAVIDVRLAAVAPADPGPLAVRLSATVPGTLTESHGVWVRRLAVLARSLQACAGMALAVVAAVAASVVAIATRSGLASRREAIEVVHALGATDAYIANRFAGRATGLAGLGGAVGALGALPVLIALAHLAAPFAGSSVPAEALSGVSLLAALPASLWVALPALPLAAAAIGFLTAHGTVRRWLRRLP